MVQIQLARGMVYDILFFEICGKSHADDNNLILLQNARFDMLPCFFGIKGFQGNSLNVSMLGNI